MNPVGHIIVFLSLFFCDNVSSVVSIRQQHVHQLCLFNEITLLIDVICPFVQRRAETSHESGINWCVVWDFRLHDAKHWHGNAVSFFSHSIEEHSPVAGWGWYQTPFLWDAFACRGLNQKKKSFPKGHWNTWDYIRVLELTRVYRWHVTFAFDLSLVLTNEKRSWWP